MIKVTSGTRFLILLLCSLDILNEPTHNQVANSPFTFSFSFSSIHDQSLKTQSELEVKKEAERVIFKERAKGGAGIKGWAMEQQLLNSRISYEIKWGW